MAEQKVTFDAVAAAANVLETKGEEVSVEAVREALGTGSPNAIRKHLSAWRAENTTPAPPLKADLPESVVTALTDWAQQFADEAGGPLREALAQSEKEMQDVLESSSQFEAERDELNEEATRLKAERDQALATIEERDEDIRRLTVELRNARTIATDALVGKAKDQLAIDGKDAQLVDLRQQLERNVASAAAVSDARLQAEMELVGATTARDNFASEIEELRAQLDAAKKDRNTIRAELDGLRARK
jgi:chromosome segregation ATPase